MSDPGSHRAMVVAITRHENGIMPYTHELDDGLLLARA